MIFPHKNIHLFSFNNITIDLNNYKDYLKKEYDFYTTFDYASVNGQEDYEADFYAAALLNGELNGVKPIDVFNDNRIEVNLTEVGSIDYKQRNFDIKRKIIGAKFTFENITGGYKYLCFNGQKITEGGELSAHVYDEHGKIIGEIAVNSSNLDNKIHQYIIDISTASGNITVILDGNYKDSSDIDKGLTDISEWNPNFEFSNVVIY